MQMLKNDQINVIKTAYGSSDEVKSILDSHADKLTKKAIEASAVEIGPKDSPAKLQAKFLIEVETASDFKEAMLYAAKADAMGAAVNNRLNALGRITAMDHAMRCLVRLEVDPFDDAAFERRWFEQSDKSASTLWRKIRKPALDEIRRQIRVRQDILSAVSNRKKELALEQEAA